MEHFDESEVREIEIDNKDYPELLKGIKKPPKALRIRGNLPPNRKIIAIAGSRKTTKQALEVADFINQHTATENRKKSIKKMWHFFLILVQTICLGIRK